MIFLADRGRESLDLFKCNKWYVILTDYYTRYIEIQSLKSMTELASYPQRNGCIEAAVKSIRIFYRIWITKIRLICISNNTS